MQEIRGERGKGVVEKGKSQGGREGVGLFKKKTGSGEKKRGRHQER